MLAKQFWRILTRPQSLVARVLKEIYFRSVHIMDANTKNNSSYMWRSILATKELIKQGVTWRVGNREKIRVWADKWLTSPVTYQVQSPVSVLSRDARVKELFIDGELKWNVSLIHRIFIEEEAETIKKIPISSRGLEDKIFWEARRMVSFRLEVLITWLNISFTFIEGKHLSVM